LKRFENVPFTREDPAEEIFLLPFYQAGGESLNEVNGDIGFKEIELDGAITPAGQNDY